MLKILIKILLFSVFICLGVFQAMGQTPLLQWQKNIPVANITALSKDRNGHIYIADVNGDILQYDDNGNKVNTYSPDKPGIVTLIEAWPALRILVFYADFQEYLFLDRFLNASTYYRLGRENIGFSSLMTLAEDNNLWLVDNENLNLVKLDNTTNQVLINASLNNYILEENNNLNFIKAYQQQVFINDATDGILIFDNFGNYVRKLPVKGLDYFNFLKEELYYYSHGAIHFINLYNLKERSVVVGKDGAYDDVLLVNGKAFLFGDDGVDVFGF